MMPISTQTLLAWVDAVGWSLLHFLWQGALLGLVYRVLRPLCHGVGARYRLGMLTLSAMLLCPLVTVCLFVAGADACAGPGPRPAVDRRDRKRMPECKPSAAAACWNRGCLGWWRYGSSAPVRLRSAHSTNGAAWLGSCATRRFPWRIARPCWRGCVRDSASAARSVCSVRSASTRRCWSVGCGRRYCCRSACSAVSLRSRSN
jgi:hypothetical protein